MGYLERRDGAWGAGNGAASTASSCSTGKGGGASDSSSLPDTRASSPDRGYGWMLHPGDSATEVGLARQLAAAGAKGATAARLSAGSSSSIGSWDGTAWPAGTVVAAADLAPLMPASRQRTVTTKHSVLDGSGFDQQHVHHQQQWSDYWDTAKHRARDATAVSPAKAYAAGAPALDTTDVAPRDPEACVGGPKTGRRAAAPVPRWKSGLYVLFNMLSVCCVVFANKIVFSHFHFTFPVTLTLLHAVATALGMEAMCRCGLFPRATVRPRVTAPVALAYVGSVVLSNWSIHLNTVGFYQICKVLITPTLVAVEFLWLRKRPSRTALFATGVLLAGVFLATCWDKQVSSNVAGAAVGLTATLVTVLYQIQAGKKQRDLGLDASQLLHQSMPAAALMLALLVPLLEPMGLPTRGNGGAWGGHGTLLGYKLTTGAAVAIVGSALLGLAVSLSAFLVIGATSALTYNVASHLKTVLIITGGGVFFGDAAGPAKLAGLALALTAVAVYSVAK